MDKNAAKPDTALNNHSRANSDAAVDHDRQPHPAAVDPAAELADDDGRSVATEPVPLWWQNHPQLSRRFTQRPTGETEVDTHGGAKPGAAPPLSGASQSSMTTSEPDRTPSPSTDRQDIAPPVRTAGGWSAHSMMATAPNGCWVLSLVLDSVSRIWQTPVALEHDSTWLIGVGLLTATAAGIAGLIQAAPIREGSPAYRRVLVHGGLIMAVMVFYVFALILRSADQEGPRAATSTLVMSVSGILAVAMSAYAGHRIRHRRPSRERVTR